LERGLGLLRRLRDLAGQFSLTASFERGRGAVVGPADADPLDQRFRDTVAMTDTAVRVLGSLPDSANGQLRLCPGLEAILDDIAMRVETLADAMDRRRREIGRVEALADWLSCLEAGKPVGVEPFAALAEEILAEARLGGPLWPACAPADQAARFVAAHSLAVARVVARVVRHHPPEPYERLDAILAALIHDAGMLRVPADILAHTGPLDDPQKRLVERHTRAGAQLAGRLLPQSGWLVEVAAEHHERLDGTGYPGGLVDTQLGVLGRLVAVCDVYAAMCAPRPHRAARETRSALTETLLLADQGLLDRRPAEQLLHALSFYPVGSVVELADGAAAVVVATPASHDDVEAACRPVVAVLTDARGRALPAPRHLDLAASEGSDIVRSLTPGERRGLLGKRYPELAA
jgi:HD-GYP domain-containing protein (c-di-GMP phosphodiesterase class II)